MSAPVFVAVNLTDTAIVLEQLRVTVPASGSVSLSGSNEFWRIQNDPELLAAITADLLVINNGTTTLTKAQSLQYLYPVASEQALTGVAANADVTQWSNVSAALGGQAGASANLIFKSDGSGGGTMGKNTQVIPRRITVAASGDADYTSIATAVAAAISGGASGTVPWEVVVHPGTYTEPPMTMQAGVTLRGTTTRLDTVYVAASNAAADLFTFTTGGSVSGLNCSGVTDPAKAIFRVSTANSLAVLHGVAVSGCSNGIIVSGGAKAVATYFSVNITGPGEEITGKAMQVTGSGSYIGLVSPFFSCPSALLPYYAVNPVQTGISVNAGASLYAVGGTMRLAYKDSTADVIFVDGGGRLTLLASEISQSNNGIHIGSSGTGSKAIISSCSFIGNVLNAKNESSTGVIFAMATSDQYGYSGVAGGVLTGILQNQADSSTHLMGEVSYDFPSGSSVGLADFFHDTSSTGCCGGGTVTDAGGLTVDVGGGDGWIVRPYPASDAAQFKWAAVTALPLTASTTNYVVFNSTTPAIEAQTSPPSGLQILLATAITDGSGIRFLHETKTVLEDPAARLHEYLLLSHKVQLKSGLGVVQGTTVRKLDVSSGSYYLALNDINYAGSGGDATWSYFYGTNGATEVASQTLLNITQYDAAGTLTAMTAGYYRMDTLYLTSDGRLSLVYGTAQYTTQLLAESASLANKPTFIEDSACPLAKVVVLQGTGIASIIDSRPTWGSGGSGSGGVSIHSALAGLSADDHTQYLLVSGARAMSGNLDMGGNSITNVNLVDGIDVNAHAARHTPGGADALTTGTPVAVSVGDSPADGSAASFARSDHQHGITAGTPTGVGTANAVGTASSVARSDHVHDHGAQTSGTLHAAAVAAGASGFMTGADKTKLDSITAGATNTPLTASVPENVTKATAAVGVATAAARADHKHDITTASAGDTAVGGTSGEGTATSLARSDHTHALPAYGTTAGTFCQGNDARLADARTPTVHATTHKHAGGDEIAVVSAAANAIPKAGTGAKLDIGWLPTGTASTDVCVGNDSRLADDRTASGLRTATTVVSISGAAAPSVGQTLVATSSTNATWQTPAAGGGSTLACAQARRTTTVATPTTFTDISFDTTDIETDAATVDHVAGTPTRIRVLATGTYMVRYAFESNISVTGDVSGRALLNGLTVIPGSAVQSVVFGGNETDIVNAEFIVTLMANDYITIQHQIASGTGTTTAGAVFSITKLSGVKGDTGSGSTVTVQEEGTPVANTPHSTLNFVGAGVTVADGGAGVATVTVPGLTAGEVSGTSTITTSSATDVLMTGMTVTPAAGTYLVWFSGDYISSSATTMTADIWVAGAVVTASERACTQSTATQKYVFACQALVTVNGAQAIEGRWRRGTGTLTNTRRTLSYLKVG